MNFDRKFLLAEHVKLCWFMTVMSVAALVASLSGYTVAVDVYLGLLCVVAVLKLFGALADRRAAELDTDHLTL